MLSKVVPDARLLRSRAGKIEPTQQVARDAGNREHGACCAHDGSTLTDGMRATPSAGEQDRGHPGPSCEPRGPFLAGRTRGTTGADAVEWSSQPPLGGCAWGASDGTCDDLDDDQDRLLRAQSTRWWRPP